MIADFHTCYNNRMFPITIKAGKSAKDLAMLKQFMLQQPQFYPRFDTWVNDRCIPNIRQGNFQSIIVISRTGRVVGNAVYTQIEGNKIKLKNFRIDPQYRNRDLGHFLLKQVSHETHYLPMVLDVTVDNYAGVEFFIRNGFNIVQKARLYLPNQDEYIMERP